METIHFNLKKKGQKDCNSKQDRTNFCYIFKYLIAEAILNPKEFEGEQQT